MTGFKRSLYGLIFLISLPSLAELSMPVSESVQENGYSNYPVLNCPQANEFSQNMLTKLQELKAAIKKEANCENVETDISSLSQLVTKDKDTFLQLVTKGANGGLTDTESDTVKNYVSTLTSTTSSLLQVITGNGACFDEDKKANSLSFISSLIGEGSKLLSILDPTGGTIAIAGNVLSGFIKGLENIKKVGYNFKEHEQRAAYNEALCALYDYKKEFDQYLYADTQIKRLLYLDYLLESQIRVVTDNCPECSDLQVRIASLNDRMLRQGDLTLVEDWPEVEEQDFASAAESINDLYTKDLGTYVYRSSKSRRWIKYRVETLKNAHFEADLNIQYALEQLEDIENFMISRQAPKFLKYEIQLANKLKSELINLVIMEGSQFMHQAIRELKMAPPQDLFNSGANGLGHPMALMDTGDIFPILNYLERSLNKYSRAQDKARLMTFLGQTDRAIKKFVSAAQNSIRYCNFFMYSQYWYPHSVANVCEGSSWGSTGIEPLAQELQIIAEGQERSLRIFRDNLGQFGSEWEKKDFIIEQNKEHTLDWIDSLSLVIESMLENPELVTLKEPNPVNPVAIPGLD